MDKRRHRRLTTRIDIFFSIAQSGIHSGLLLDYGKGGAFVSFRKSPQQAVPSDTRSWVSRNIQIHFSLDEKEFLLDGVIAHVSEAGLGVRFQSVDALAFSALTEAARRVSMAGNVPVTQLRERKQFDSRQWLARCDQLVGDFFREMAPEFLDGFCQTLLVAVEQRKGGVEAQECLDAIAVLNAAKSTVADRLRAAYMDHVRRPFTQAIAAQTQGEQTPVNSERPISAESDEERSPSLRLVEKDVFEDWLLIKVAASRVELALAEPLAEIALRIEACSGKKLRDDRHVFSASIFFNQFHTLLKVSQVSHGVIRLFFKTTVDSVIERFARLYQNINQSLVQMGVLPDLNLARELQAKKGSVPEQRQTTAQTPIANEARAAPRNPRASARGGSDFAQGAGAADVSQNGYDSPASNDLLARDAFVTANRLLRMHRQTQLHGASSRASAGASAVTAEVNDTAASPLMADVTGVGSADVVALVRALNQVSNELSAAGLETDGIETETTSLPSQVLTRLKQLDIPVGEHVQDALHMMDSLVANIADEQRMTGDLRTEFCKIQVPLAALQVADPDIFHSEQHPVRELLNYLAVLAEPTSANFRSNAETVKTVIHRLMAAAPLNEQSVGLILKDIKKQIEREKSIIERNVQRVVESCDGRQRIAQVNDFLNQALEERLGGKAVPRGLLRLLDTGWRELMRRSLLRDGPDSRAWQTSLDVIDDLLKFLGVRPIPEDALHYSLETLLKIIDKGMAKAASPNADIAALIRELRASALATGVELVETGSFQAKGKRKDLQSVFPVRLCKKVQRLKEGQWLEYGVKSENKTLCQVAWISQRHDKFAFVNQQGMRVAELSDEQMLNKLQDGDIHLLGDGQVSAVEKGLDSLIQKIYEKLSYDTSHDQLTGLLGRKEFEKNLAQSVARAKRHASRYALIYTDLLQFKLVNNLCGYEAGDHLLQQVGQIISQVGLDGQVSGRIGGNEFAIILPVETDTEAYRFACQIKSAIEAEKFTLGKNTHSLLTAVSLCTFDSQTNHVLELLRTVESAAQIAKSSGLKEVQMVKPGDIRFQERDSMMSWVARITNALEKDQLRLRCQKIAPAVELHPSWLPHYEILLTVVDDAGVHVPPAEFIKAAEEYGRMAEVDRWVINQVLSWMKDNGPYLKYFGGFSINLSGHTLNDDSFLDFIFEKLVRYDVPRNKVIFEITETTAVANLDEAADFIAEMKEIGCRFSLDDFGAGQSSYAYLKKLPVDFIKIDGAFIKKIDSDKVDYALVKSITEMGHFLNKHIVAEFVSDKAKYDTVVSLGVDYLQGYHLGKPIMLDTLIDTDLTDHP